MILTTTTTIRVERFADVAALAPLAGRWNELAAGVPFRSFEWLESWWRAYGGGPGRELFALAAFGSNDELIGLAPWYLDRSASLRGTIRFLGSGEVCSDYLTILCRNGAADDVTVALADWLVRADDPLTGEVRDDWDAIELGGIDRDDVTVNRLVEHLAARGKLVYRRERASCWRVLLPATWDEYLARLSKSHRKQIRRLQRNYFASGRAGVRLARSAAEVERGLDFLVSLHQRRRESLGQRGSFASEAFARFHRLAAPRLLEAGRLRLAWLELDGRTVAAEYQVLGRDVVYAYQSGIEPVALEHEPGRLITIATLERAIAEGRRAFDFLRGDELYKAHWRARPRPTYDVRIVADSPHERLRHGLWWAGGTMKAWLKQRLHLSDATC